MKWPKNILTLSLMVSSIALLIILQFFWLRSSYEKAFSDFRRETNMLFRSTVMSMRDSMLLQNIEPLPGDTLPGIARIFLPQDSLVEYGRTDSMVRYMGMKDRSAGIQIVVSTATPDSLHPDMLKPLAARFHSIQMGAMKGANRSFIIRLSPDTLDVDSMSLLYKEALATANIDAPFYIKHVRSEPADIPGPMTDPPVRDFLRRVEHLHHSHSSNSDFFADTISSDHIRTDPLNRYTASLTGVRTIILKEITPQILFTLFLTFTTVTAFVLMYRNQRTQQRLMETKNNFINNVTHELKTPVATVSVALEALKNFNAMNNPRLAQEYLDIAQRELSRLSMIADKILKTSVLENKGVEFNPEKIDLDVVVQQILRSMKPVFEKKNAVVIYEKAGATWWVWGGALPVADLVTNLIDNALKYSVNTPVVSITLKDTGGAVMLSVKDQGIGIAPEYHRKIFEKFFRVPTGDVHNIKGYGLGLSHVASVVKSHKGHIKVNSKPGQGSEFVITLPKTPRDFN